MERTKAKEYIEEGMRLSIDYGERIGSLAKKALHDEEITAGEADQVNDAVINFRSGQLARVTEWLSHRGTACQAMADFASRIGHHLRSNPAVAIDALVELSTAESIQSMAHLDIPIEVSHAIRVLGWNRPGWSVEKLEAGIVSACRNEIKSIRKGGKGK